MFVQLLLALLEHQRAGAGLRQAVAKQPDRLGVGKTAGLGQIHTTGGKQVGSPLHPHDVLKIFSTIFQSIVQLWIDLTVRNATDRLPHQFRRGGAP
jgi:hypothetical protein